MRMSIYLSAAAMAAALAGCLWVPGDGNRGDRNGGYGGDYGDRHDSGWHQGRSSGGENMNRSRRSNDEEPHGPRRGEGW